VKAVLLDPLKLLQACARACDFGAPFTEHTDPRYLVMLKLAELGAVEGTRHDDLGKTFWSVTTTGEAMLANARAQAARDLAESIRQRSAGAR